MSDGEVAGSRIASGLQEPSLSPALSHKWERGMWRVGRGKPVLAHTPLPLGEGQGVREFRSGAYEFF